jgi:hypothetical protein
MNVYKVTCEDVAASKPCFTVTMREAHEYGRDKFSTAVRSAVRIELVSFIVNQQNVVQLLNGRDPELELLRTWKLTPRGGMVSCANGE